MDTKRILMYCLIIAFLFLGGIFIFVQNKDYIDGNVLNLAMLDKKERGENPYVPIWMDSNLLEYLLFPPLLLSNAERTEVKPYIAESYTISEDGLVYTFNIKKNISWSDGTKLTGHDVKFSFEAFTKPKTRSIHFVDIAKKLVSLDADDTSFVMTLNASHAPLLDYLSQIAIMPKHMMEKENIEEFADSDFWKNPVVSGMYMLAEESAERKILKINPHYFGKKPNIEEIHIHANTRMNFDIYLADSVAKIVNYRALRSYKEHFIPSQRYRYLSYNIAGKDGNQNPPMQDLHVREAIAKSIDRAYMIKNIYNNITAIPVLNTTITADELPSFDINTAKEALAKSNYDLNRPLRLGYYYNETNPNDKYFINKVVQDLEAVGFKVQLVQENSIDTLIAKRNFDIVFKDFTSPAPIDRMLDLSSEHKFSALLGGKGEFDDLLRRIRQELDPIEREKLEIQLYTTAEPMYYTYPIMSVSYATYVYFDRLKTPANITFGYPVALFDFQFENWEIMKK